MTKRYVLHFDARDDVDPATVLEIIARDVSDGSESGAIRGESSEPIGWELDAPGEGVAIDRRQRLAAAALVMAFDLPQEMHAAAVTTIEAARICPGMTTGDLSPMGAQGRLAALTFAKRLIDEMVGEIAAGMVRPGA